MTNARPAHLQGLYDNFAEVRQLIDIHRRLTGKKRGRRVGTDVVNACGIVLAVACWESFVEDLAALAFDFLLTNAGAASHSRKILALAGQPLLDSTDKRAIWQLSGDGWK